MRVHGICLVKDEADIVEQTLKAAQAHFDFIYVYDNGSTDGTWEILQHLARQSGGHIVIFKRAERPFSESLRGEVFAHYRRTSAYGDWWGRIDGDHIHIDNPKEFLAGVPEEYPCVFCSCYQYYFTDRDYLRYQESPEFYSDSVPIEQRIRYYLNNWSELWFVRHVKGTLWDRYVAWPYGLGRIYPTRIRLKHFQYRSPEQIQRRLSSRLRQLVFRHERVENWRDAIAGKASPRVTHDIREMTEGCIDWKSRIMKASDLDYDNLDGHLVARPDLLPPLQHNRLRTVLPAHVLKILHNGDLLCRGALKRMKVSKTKQ